MQAIGYPAAWAIAKVVKEKNRSMFVMLSIVPALVSQLLLIYSIMQLLQSGGVVMTLLERLGICSASDSILYTTKAVVLVLVYEYLPYMILCLYSCLEKLTTMCLRRPTRWEQGGSVPLLMWCFLRAFRGCSRVFWSSLSLWRAALWSLTRLAARTA